MTNVVKSCALVKVVKLIQVFRLSNSKKKKNGCVQSRMAFGRGQLSNSTSFDLN